MRKGIAHIPYWSSWQIVVNLIYYWRLKQHVFEFRAEEPVLDRVESTRKKSKEHPDRTICIFWACAHIWSMKRMASSTPILARLANCSRSTYSPAKNSKILCQRKITSQVSMTCEVRKSLESIVLVREKRMSDLNKHHSSSERLAYHCF